MSDRGKILERVEHLMALVDSPNENESRNAAVLAVKLIRRHEFKVTDPKQMLRTESLRGIGLGLDDIMETMFEEVMRSSTRTRSRVHVDPLRTTQARTDKPAPKNSDENLRKPGRPPRGRAVKPATQSNKQWEAIVCNWEQPCICCGDRLRKGEAVWWWANWGCLHERCFTVTNGREWTRRGHEHDVEVMENEK